MLSTYLLPGDQNHRSSDPPAVSNSSFSISRFESRNLGTFTLFSSLITLMPHSSIKRGDYPQISCLRFQRWRASAGGASEACLRRIAALRSAPLRRYFRAIVLPHARDWIYEEKARESRMCRPSTERMTSYVRIP